ncbi:MAG: hypothetical protein IPP31_06705 [Chitinophagaceae bacterium]|nr:hypothetical protein [Chitinophagaceae bacterium]
MKHTLKLLPACISFLFATGTTVAQNNAAQVADLAPAQRSVKPIAGEQKPQAMLMPVPRANTQNGQAKVSAPSSEQVKPENDLKAIALEKITPAIPGGEEGKAILNGQTKSQDPVIFSPPTTGNAVSEPRPVLKRPTGQNNSRIAPAPQQSIQKE